jgi:cytidine deaminase
MKAMKIFKINEISSEDSELVYHALKARQNAYAPYSHYFVGAALLDSNGNLFTGCNIESADYTLTSHAEMVAIDSMVKTGSLKVSTIAIALHSSGNPAMPCGLCRQKLIEFAENKNLKIIAANLNDNDEIDTIYVTTLEELIPFSFGKDQLD